MPARPSGPVKANFSPAQWHGRHSALNRMLEQKWLDGLKQTLPIRVVMNEMFVTPKHRGASVTLVGQGISDQLETLT
jgi:hypothetical protein